MNHIPVICHYPGGDTTEYFSQHNAAHYICLGEGRGGEVKMLQTSDIQTYRPSDEAGPRGAFAPNYLSDPADLSLRRENTLLN